MSNFEAILRLYSHVISEDIIQHRLNDADLQENLQTMVGVYAPQLNISKVTNFNDVLYRCAYLHMYTPLYTAIVKSTMLRMLSEETVQNAAADSKVFKMCSLGGGPGTDVIGVFSALDDILSHSVQFESVITIIDCMGRWKSTFELLLNEFRKRYYGSISTRFADNVFHWDYIESDLLGPMSCKVWDAISSSSFISMNKFVSVLKLEDAEIMIKKIFTVMGPGAFVLFIDDASDQLTHMILRIARENRFLSIHGPFENEYSFEELKNTRFGHTSCYKGNVVALLLRKPLVNIIGSIIHPLVQKIEANACKKSFLSLCSECERGINKTLNSIIKNSVVDANCISCEDEYKTPVSSKSSSPISWKSFGRAAECETEEEITDFKNNNYKQRNTSTELCVDIKQSIESSFGKRQSTEPSVGKRQSTESVVDNMQYSTTIEIPLSDTCEEYGSGSFRGCGSQCVVS